MAVQKTKFPKTIYVAWEDAANEDPYLAASEHFASFAVLDDDPVARVSGFQKFRRSTRRSPKNPLAVEQSNLRVDSERESERVGWPRPVSITRGRERPGRQASASPRGAAPSRNPAPPAHEKAPADLQDEFLLSSAPLTRGSGCLALQVMG